MDFSKLYDDADFDELFKKVQESIMIFKVFFANSVKELEWQISHNIKPFVLTVLNFKWSLTKKSSSTRYYSSNGKQYKYCYVEAAELRI